MEIKQSSWSNHTSFDFKSDGFGYSVKDRSGSRTQFIKFLDLNLSALSEIEEKNSYFRNVGGVWLVIGLFCLAVQSYGGALVWGGLGFICTIVYWVARTKFKVIQSNYGNIYIIVDVKTDEILSTISKGFNKAVMEQVGAINYTETFESEKTKYQNLQRNGIIDESEFNTILREMEESKDKFIKVSDKQS